jgi:hypothetical protein
MKDLFGQETRPVTYRTGAYPATPGTGPAGMTCRQCKYKRSGGTGSRSHPKCALVNPTSGPGTDIRVSAPACRMFEVKS